MRVLQLIDSLHAGGAERVAVNIANALNRRGVDSFICCTREEGNLKTKIDSGVGYLFLDKQSTFDFSAMKRLKKFIKEHEINVLHAHGTSFFLATFIKKRIPNLRLIWHDHYGNRAQTARAHKWVLRRCSKYFDHIIVVNHELLNWSVKNLNPRGSISYMPNFVPEPNYKKDPVLKGLDGFRIIHLANFRAPKDHLNLVKAFSKASKNHSNWTLHCVGSDYKDAYSEAFHALVKETNLDGKIFVYSGRTDSANLISQCEIGVLSSNFEGLPLSLLEYGMGKLAVICTDVGECSAVVGEDGLVVPPENHEELGSALIRLMEDQALRKSLADSFHKQVMNRYSEDIFIDNLLNTYKAV